MYAYQYTTQHGGGLASQLQQALDSTSVELANLIRQEQQAQQAAEVQRLQQLHLSLQVVS